MHIFIAILSPQLNGPTYYYLIQLIMLKTNHLFENRKVVTSIAI